MFVIFSILQTFPVSLPRAPAADEIAPAAASIPGNARHLYIDSSTRTGSSWLSVYIYIYSRLSLSLFFFVFYSYLRPDELLQLLPDRKTELFSYVCVLQQPEVQKRDDLFHVFLITRDSE